MQLYDTSLFVGLFQKPGYYDISCRCFGILVASAGSREASLAIAAYQTFCQTFSREILSNIAGFKIFDFAIL